jgi:DNA invertase Pin-like site-specific DNA recombinase
MRVSGYVRVSTEDQAREGFSLEGQRRAIAAYATARGWAVAHWYTDAGVSAFTDDPRKRPAFAELLADVAARRWDALIILKLDRFARSVRVSSEMLGHFRTHGCALVSVAEGYDFGSVSGQFLYHIMGALAEMESHQISERVKRAMAVRAAQGKWNGTTPWGALLCDGVLTIDPDHADTLAWLLERLACQPPSTVAKALNERGVRTRRGNYWDWTAITTWLRAADWLLTQPDPWPERVILARAYRGAARVLPGQATHMLSGLLRCACGGRILANSSRVIRGARVDYLRCRNFTPDRPTGHGCPHGLRSAQYYEAAVFAWLRTLPDIAAHAHAAAIPTADRADLARRRRLLGLALTDETITEADYHARLAALKREEAALALPAQAQALVAPFRLLRAHAEQLTAPALNAALRLLIDRCVIRGDVLCVEPSAALTALLGQEGA